MRWKTAVVTAIVITSMSVLGLAGVSAHDVRPRHPERLFQPRATMGSMTLRAEPNQTPAPAAGTTNHDLREGQRLFDEETFGGNGRTCVTCHSRDTGTVSPSDASKRFRQDPLDPLFIHDGSDDGQGNGVTRMLADATILMRIALPPNVTLKNAPLERFVTVRRGIPTTLNTPALDPVLMLDGRQPNLEAQALGAIQDHAQATAIVSQRELELIAAFELTGRFFSSPALQRFAGGGAVPGLPLGHTESEKRGRIFFEDRAPEPPNLKPGLCATCHSGPLLNQTNDFLAGNVRPGSRFQNIRVSEFNVAHNPAITFVFSGQQNDVFDGNNDGIIEVTTPDPGRALITGIADDAATGSFDSLNAFKIPSLRGIPETAPYFHDNSAKTLEEVMAHYARFFFMTRPDGLRIVLTEQDQADIIAFLKLL
jgi:cytochrome c peroxidase